MNKLILIVISVCAINLASLRSNTNINSIVGDSTCCIYFKNSTNLEVYIGNSVSHFFDSVPFKIIKYGLVPTHNPGWLSGVYIKFSEKCSIKIFVDDFKYVPQYSAQEKWDWELFKKESISRIVVYCE